MSVHVVRESLIGILALVRFGVRLRLLQVTTLITAKGTCEGGLSGRRYGSKELGPSQLIQRCGPAWEKEPRS